MSDGKFKKGNTAGGSRKGIPNKQPSDLRDMVLSVAAGLHEDGIEAALEAWIKSSPKNLTTFWTKGIFPIMPKIVETPDLADGNLIEYQKAYIARMKNGGKDQSEDDG